MEAEKIEDLLKSQCPVKWVFAGDRYLQDFIVPKDFDQKKHIYVLFRGVDEEAEIYINGTKAFEHTCASTGLRLDQIWITPFAFDARPFLKLGEQNLIAVRVHNQVGMGGIYEPAYLISTDGGPDADKLIMALPTPTAAAN